MPAPLSPDLRQRVLEASRAASASATAERFHVSPTTVHRLRALERTTGSIEPKPHGGGRSPSLTEDDRVRFEAFLLEDVSMTHQEMARRFEAETGRSVSRATVGRHLRLWGITRKKSG